MKASAARSIAPASSGRHRSGRDSCWEPVENTASAAELDAAPIAWSRVALEDEVIAAFDAAPVPGEQLEVTFCRKEHELAALFEQLVPAESLALQRRLTLTLPGDPIARRFCRLVGARRTRLLTFLEHARRRHPLQLASMGGDRD